MAIHTVYIKCYPKSGYFVKYFSNSLDKNKNLFQDIQCIQRFKGLYVTVTVTYMYLKRLRHSKHWELQSPNNFCSVYCTAFQQSISYSEPIKEIQSRERYSSTPEGWSFACRSLSLFLIMVSDRLMEPPSSAWNPPHFIQNLGDFFWATGLNGS